MTIKHFTYDVIRNMIFMLYVFSIVKPLLDVVM